VAAWFSDALKMPQYAEAVTEHEVDGYELLDIAEQGNLADLGIKGSMHQSKVRGAIAKLAHPSSTSTRPRAPPAGRTWRAPSGPGWAGLRQRSRQARRPRRQQSKPARSKETAIFGR
jgi:hypothetical protein